MDTKELQRRAGITEAENTGTLHLYKVRCTSTADGKQTLTNIVEKRVKLTRLLIFQQRISISLGRNNIPRRMLEKKKFEQCGL